MQKFLWSEKHCYSESLWVGGISDCEFAVLTNGRTAIIDFKRKGCYFSQFVQIGGYACQIGSNGLFNSEGERFMDWMGIDDVIVFPNSGKPRTEESLPFMDRFCETVAIHKHQQEYDNA